MSPKISVVINTLNDERNIKRALESVKWADEIVVCDMYSQDKTVEIAKKLGAKVFFHKKEEFVERARNFALSKASGNWILVIDPDEQIPSALAKRLQQIVSNTKQIDYARIPRKNLIFGHFMQASMWWPDLNVRFFKKGAVEWTDEIHRPPKISGMGIDLPANENLAIIHHNYQSISQFIERLNRYTTVEANQLIKQNYEFKWPDLIQKPLSEFLSRFFANRGFEDGLYGLALSFLQAFSFLVVYLKLWEMSGFKQEDINLQEIEEQKSKVGEALGYWIKKSRN